MERIQHKDPKNFISPANDAKKTTLQKHLDVTDQSQHPTLRIPAIRLPNSAGTSTQRALNMIWNAAGTYDFMPRYVLDNRCEDLTFYWNMVIGFIHKRYDIAPLASLFQSFAGTVHEDEYSILTFLALSHAVYTSELPDRPALDALRTDAARASLAINEGLILRTTGELIHEAYDHEILKEPYTLPHQAQQLLVSLKIAPSMTAGAIKDYLQQLFFDYYKEQLSDQPYASLRQSHPRLRRHIRHIGHFASGQLIFRSLEDSPVNENPEEAGGRLSDRITLLAIRRKDKEEESTRSMLTQNFGSSLYTQKESSDIDRLLCIGHHAGCHLLFTDGRGNKIAPPKNPSAFYEDSTEERICEQRMKNLAYYSLHRAVCEHAINSLHRKIENILLISRSQEEIPSRSGSLNSAVVWRGTALHEQKVFTRYEEQIDCNFGITLLLDASASQIHRQEYIASESYIIAEAARLCGLPMQVYSYLSTGGFTVLNRLKKYDASYENTNRNNKGIFRYAAAGWNRDGLALRGIGYLLCQSKISHHLILMLTDSSPNDDRRIRVSGSHFKSKAYTTDEGIEDTAGEVRALRKQNIRIAGLFYGSNQDWPSAGRIFGNELLRIKNLQELSSKAGNFIAEEILRTRDIL